ncbi:hypothetical protein Tco_1008789 [Tanacetum coccineum]
MNPQETQQVVVRDEKWVPFTKRVKISSTNVRLETTVPQWEETFQVVIDLYKNFSCFKAFTISADVLEIFMQQFWMILDICPRVEGVNFTDEPDDDTTLAFIIKLGYKGLLYKHTNPFVDHMHQPWRTLAIIINKCRSRKIASNDKLRKSRIDILWGMFYRENVDYPKLIWEDLAFQIDHRKEKRSRRENMPFPRFTKIIINSLPQFVRIGEDYQEYGLAILEVMLNDAIKQSESYQMFIKYSTESEHEPEPVKRKTSSRRVVKKNVTIFDDDSIISDDPDIALELGKSINKIEAEEAEATRQVHATHVRIVIQSVLEPTRRRKLGKVTSDPPKKLKGVSSLTLEEQEAADTMQSLKESRKTSRRQPSTGGSSEGTSTILGVPDESTVISATSSKGTKDQLDDEEKDDKEVDADDEGDDHISDTQDTDDEDDETESDEDKIYKYNIRVHKDEDEEMLNAEVERFDKGDEELRVAKLEKDVSKLKKIVLFAEALAALKIQVPSVIDNYLGSKVGDRKHDDDEDPSAGPNQGKKTKRRRTNESESSKKPSTTKDIPKGKALSKGSKTIKSASTKEPVEEPTTEVVMDDAGKDVVRDDDQPQDTSEPKTAKTPNLEWFTQPPRPPTPDPKWNKH